MVDPYGKLHRIWTDCFLIAGTALFKYPDTIRKTITIDDLGSAEWITANQAGMIDRFLWKTNHLYKRTTRWAY